EDGIRDATVTGVQTCALPILEEYTQNSRTGLGSALSIDDKGLSTIIGPQNKDAAGNSISPYMKYAFNRLRTWDSRSKTNVVERKIGRASCRERREEKDDREVI